MRKAYTEIGNLELRDHCPFLTVRYPFPLPIDTPAKITLQTNRCRARSISIGYERAGQNAHKIKTHFGLLGELQF